MEKVIDVEEVEESITTQAIQNDADPHDPLGWSSARKMLILLSVGIWIFLGPANMVIVGPALAIISEHFNSQFSSSTYLIGGPLLAYGVSSFVWVPLGNRYGVRLVFSACAISAACICVWGAKSSSFASLVAARTLASAFFAPPETLAPQMIGDVFHVQDKAKAITFIGIFQATGFAGGPLVGAYVIQNSHLGWRWVQWIMAILSFVTAVALLLFFPETQYLRKEKAADLQRRWLDNFRFWPVSGGGRPKVQSVFTAFRLILPLAAHPIVILNTTFISLVLCANSYLLTTQSLTYLIEYHFTAGHTGLTFIAPIVGTWIAMAFCGVLADRIFVGWMRVRNSEPQPEHRLILLPFTGLLGVGGCLLFGIGTQEHCHWIVPLIGSAFVSFCFISSLSISFAYLLDIYKDQMDMVMVILHGVKNLASFALSYAIVPWNTAAGYTIPFVVMAILMLVAHLLMGLCYWKGDAIRRWTTEQLGTHDVEI